MNSGLSMRNALRPIALALLAGLLAGCNPSGLAAGDPADPAQPGFTSGQRQAHRESVPSPAAAARAEASRPAAAGAAVSDPPDPSGQVEAAGPPEPSEPAGSSEPSSPSRQISLSSDASGGPAPAAKAEGSDQTAGASAGASPDQAHPLPLKAVESGGPESGGKLESIADIKEPPVPKWEGDSTLKFSELYSSVGVRGVKMSEKVLGLSGQEVEMTGYMAPPLKAEVDFFVLTKVPLAVCPFCSSDADWPTDIVVVYMPDGKEIKPTEKRVKVTGTLDTGSYTDEETGFVSLIRIYAEKVEVLK